MLAPTWRPHAAGTQHAHAVAAAVGNGADALLAAAIAAVALPAPPLETPPPVAGASVATTTAGTVGGRGPLGERLRSERTA